MSPALRLIRPHQWIKNLLVFVPIVAGHQVGVPGKLTNVSIAFVAFCFAASANYVINDLLDAEADRQHPLKARRPISSGAISRGVALAIAAVCAAIALAACVFLDRATVGAIVIYLVLAQAYSLVFKRKLVIDVIVLAALYTLRLYAGGEAADVRLSMWLMALSMFAFLTLAFAKRYSELTTLSAAGQLQSGVANRGYRLEDVDLVRSVGPMGAYAATLVFAMYVDSADAAVLYARPRLLWVAAPLMLYWLLRMWFAAHRGELRDDPLVWAVKDRMSYVVAAGVAIAFFLARGGWPQ